MDWITLRNKLNGAVKKYKYVVLVLVLGMLLMALPESGEPIEKSPEIIAADTSAGLSEELETILSQIDGVGRVSVLLTESMGEETIYQTDEDNDVSSDSQSIRIETVIITDSDREEQGLVRQVNPPAWMGAIIVCQGADQPAVRLSVVEAVANATGISTDRITVLKMK